MQSPEESGIFGKMSYLLSWALNNIAMVILVMMMLLVTIDVILRYSINQPVQGSPEIIEVMLVCVVFFILAQTQAKKKHATAEAVTTHLSKLTQSSINTATYFISMLFSALVTWRLGEQALIVLSKTDTTATLRIPIYPFVFVAAFGCAVLTAVLLKDFIGFLTQVIRSRVKKEILLLSLTIAVTVLVTVALWTGWYYPDIPPMVVGIVGFVLLIFLIMCGMPVLFVMGIVSFWGFTYLSGIGGGLSFLGTVMYRKAASYDFSIIPLFMLMGEVCFASGLSRDLYNTVHKWLGQLPGGLAMATVAACAGFAAVSGSSVATAATMGTVALPEMKRFNYSSSLATGCVAAGGTIGILIPPSVGFVMYGIITEQSIGRLFIAGIIPGILEAVFYIITIFILCKRNPLLGPPAPPTRFMEKFLSLKSTWTVLVLFLLVIGGIYMGVFTPTEAAGVGAFGALIIALGKRSLNWQGFKSSLVRTAESSGMALGILLTSMLLSYFVAVTRLPFDLAEIVAGLDIHRLGILAVILAIYLILGCVMPALAMIVLTVPIFFPVITALGYDPIWFGVIIVRVMEMAGITPPIGINVFVIKGIAKDVDMYTIFRGVVPFLIADVAEIALLIAIPQLSLWLPSLMWGQ
ncbi:TRAP transporter large permease subunit [Chloroflexota bacterium]